MTEPAPMYPRGVYAYFDMIQVWFLYAPSPRRRRWLDQRCPNFELRPHINVPYAWPYELGLQLNYPIPADVLRWLERIGSSSHRVLFNGGEFALDWTFRTEEELCAAEEFVRAHFVKKRSKQKARERGAFYIGGLGDPSRVVVYGDEPCRMTGETLCLHAEWRINGSPALRQAGICLRGLSTFNHHEFWKRRLIFSSLDPARVGQFYNNKIRGTPRRRSYYKMWGSLKYDFNARAGGILLNYVEDGCYVHNVFRTFSSQARPLALMGIRQDYGVTHLLPSISGVPVA